MTGIIYRNLLKPILFTQDPESVHDRFTQIGSLLGKSQLTRHITSALFGYQNKMLESTVCGVKFSNPVGLSAGFDKDAKLVSIMGSVGFGFTELGTVTFSPYGGNPKPRLYRLPKSKALVVYYGLKNEGAVRVIGRIKSSYHEDIVLGASIGKTNSKKTVSLDDGIKDYVACLREFEKSGVAEYYTINISCPNTFGGEPYTTPLRLKALLHEIRKIKTSRPIFIKMPINLPWGEFKKLVEVAVRYKIDALVIGNLNKDHKSMTIKDEIPKHIKGGISGRPTWRLSNELISRTYQEFGDKIKIIGVGGIFSAEDAYEKICRGASLVEVITGMIFEGPQVIGDINRGVVARLERDGYKNISEAVGSLQVVEK